jgi:hypothetical protein
VSVEAFVLVAIAGGLVAVVATWVALPLIRGVPDAPSADPRAVALLAEREAVLATLRDLDADHAAARLDEVSYQAMRADAVERGVRVLGALDALETARAGETADLVAEIEREIAARAAAPAVRVERCARCGRAVAADDRFCAGCGEPLPSLSVDETWA